MSEGRGEKKKTKKKKKKEKFPKIKGLAEKSERVSGNARCGRGRRAAARSAGGDEQD